MWSSLPVSFQCFALSGFGCSVMCLSLLWWPNMNSLTLGLKCLFGNPKSPPESPITLLIDSAALSIFQNKERCPFKAWCPWGHAPELSRGVYLIRMSIYLNPKNIPKLRGYDLWNNLLLILSMLFLFQSIMNVWVLYIEIKAVLAVPESQGSDLPFFLTLWWSYKICIQWKSSRLSFDVW